MFPLPPKELLGFVGFRNGRVFPKRQIPKSLMAKYIKYAGEYATAFAQVRPERVDFYKKRASVGVNAMNGVPERLSPYVDTSRGYVRVKDSIPPHLEIEFETFVDTYEAVYA